MADDKSGKLLSKYKINPPFQSQKVISVHIEIFLGSS